MNGRVALLVPTRRLPTGDARLPQIDRDQSTTLSTQVWKLNIKHSL